MLDLLPYIPPIYHFFYKHLPTQSHTRQSEQSDHDHSEEGFENDEVIYD
jgi:hypothetical protein